MGIKMENEIIDLENIWQEYGLDELQEGMQTLFPEYEISLEQLLEKIMAGNILGAIQEFLLAIISGMSDSVIGMKNIFVWLLVLGVVSALLTHFIEIFDKHQIADLSFYFVYLLTSTVLLKCFAQIMQTAQSTMENIVMFVKLLVPTYLLAVGVATGITTASAYYQLMLLLLYGVEKILFGMVIPMVYGYCLLSIVNGVWIEEKLVMVIELLEKCVGWILKGAMGIVTGLGIFQAVITPVIDSVKTSGLQKALSALPGVGNVADGVVEMVIGSAVIIKNSIGIVLLILLLVLCAAPLLEIFLTALLVRVAAAFLGIVSNKRITACVNRTGEACMQLFRTVGTAMLLFLIILSIIAAASGIR